ncbi:hypothetical protein CA54_30540 [Symmachiella macrocystis]|uniref:DUF1501 domain-containing protein n=1 Tax=Symmachiella macrocystis TaxID=2527985 RepID=A0A5C6BS06_9PLAN|nr:DUF1501 domain-containing protein [Symmachiella macrocystis]TWU14211.1 hypothetical protein CA54_30540 [Symmachiella macrocystis]
MLTLLGSSAPYCDGLSRRSFLQIGSLAVGGLSLPQLLAAEDAAGTGTRKHSVIMVYLTGGLSHQDTFDLKPDAPDGIRGEFTPIDSNVPGIQVGNLLPKTAQLMDKIAVIRSIVGLRDEHSSFQNVTGFPKGESERDGHPSFGSIISHEVGSADGVTPAFVDLFPTMQHRPYNSPGSGVLGPTHAGIKADGEDLASMKLRYIEGGRFDNRQKLLASLDDYRRQVDNEQLSGVDSNYERAFSVLTSSKLVDALDVENEDPRLRERYGKGSAKHLGDGAPMWNDQLLAARRLVEAGVRCVTVAYGFWDTHGNNFGHLKKHLPLFDTGVSALVQDIYDRGLDQDVSVVVWGEFGRTPKINDKAGRDHWARVSHALLSGGNMPTGQVIGSTDKIAGEAQTRPVHYQDVLATLYHNLGVEPHRFIRRAGGATVPILPGSARIISELT